MDDLNSNTNLEKEYRKCRSFFVLYISLNLFSLGFIYYSQQSFFPYAVGIFGLWQVIANIYFALKVDIGLLIRDNFSSHDEMKFIGRSVILLFPLPSLFILIALFTRANVFKVPCLKSAKNWSRIAIFLFVCEFTWPVLSFFYPNYNFSNISYWFSDPVTHYFAKEMGKLEVAMKPSNPPFSEPKSFFLNFNPLSYVVPVQSAQIAILLGSELIDKKEIQYPP